MVQNNYDQTNQKNINVEPVWIQGITGRNVTIGVVDDGMLRDAVLTYD